MAAILSVVESCRRFKLPVCTYLAAVLPGLADLKPHDERNRVFSPVDHACSKLTALTLPEK